MAEISITSMKFSKFQNSCVHVTFFAFILLCIAADYQVQCNWPSRGNNNGHQPRGHTNNDYYSGPRTRSQTKAAEHLREEQQLEKEQQEPEIIDKRPPTRKNGKKGWKKLQLDESESVDQIIRGVGDLSFSDVATGKKSKRAVRRNAGPKHGKGDKDDYVPEHEPENEEHDGEFPSLAASSAKLTKRERQKAASSSKPTPPVKQPDIDRFTARVPYSIDKIQSQRRNENQKYSKITSFPLQPTIKTIGPTEIPDSKGK